MSASNLPANDLRRVALCWDANDGAVELLSWPADRGVALTWPRRALAADSRFHALTLPGRLRHLRRAVELARSEGIAVGDLRAVLAGVSDLPSDLFQLHEVSK